MGKREVTRCLTCRGEPRRAWFPAALDPAKNGRWYRCRRCGLVYRGDEVGTENRDAAENEAVSPVDLAAWAAEGLGLEPGVAVVRGAGAARAELEAAGWRVKAVPSTSALDVGAGSSSSANGDDLSPGSVDLVVLGALGCDSTPRETMAWVRSVLRAGGVVAVTTCDASRAVAMDRRLDPQKAARPPRVALYEPISLKRLLEGAGLPVVLQRRDTDAATVSCLAMKPGAVPTEVFRERPRVAIVAGGPEICRSYRSRRIVASLERAGIQFRVVDDESVDAWGDVADEAQALLRDVDILILERVAYRGEIEQILAVARRLEVRTLWASDDLIFVPGAQRWVDGLRHLDEHARQLYDEGVCGYEKALEACDGFLASTPFLAHLARRLGHRAFVVENTLCGPFLEQPATTSSSATGAPADRPVVIGYGAGTATHDRDFEQIVPAIAEVMERHPEAILRIVGHLAVPEPLQRFRDRIEKVDAVPWEQWPSELARFDVNLAPLERRNPYCRAKSGLKFFEAGVLGIPTVASDLEAYQSLVVDGENGYLAGDHDGWVQALSALIESVDLRARVGSAARRDVERRCGPDAAALEVIRTLTAILATDSAATYAAYADFHASVPALARVEWLVPAPFAGSGGHNDIFQVAARLRERGFEILADIDVSGQPKLADRERLHRLVDEHFVPLEAEIRPDWREGRNADVIFSTLWSSAFHSATSRSSAEKLYLVQDFEPYFYVRGAYEYALAENSYRLGLKAVTLGPWLAERMDEQYGMDATFMDFPVDRRFYGPSAGPRAADRPRVVFFAQPGKARRCYRLGVDALARVVAARPDVDIVMFGSNDIDIASLPFQATTLGILTDEQLADLYRSATLGFTISFTNPSLVPFSMLACGCPVVELDMEQNRRTFGVDNGVVLAEPTADGLASAMQALLRDEGMRKRAIRDGLEFAGPLCFDHTTDGVERAVLRAYLTGAVTDTREHLGTRQVHADASGPRLSQGREIRQRFHHGLPRLSSLELRVSTFDGPVDGELRVEVHGPGGEVVARGEVDVAGARSWDWITIDLGDVEVPCGALDLVVHATSEEAARAPSVAYSRRLLQEDPTLVVDGEPTPGSLALKTYGRRTRKRAESRPPRRRDTPKRRPAALPTVDSSELGAILKGIWSLKETSERQQDTILTQTREIDALRSQVAHQRAVLAEVGQQIGLLRRVPGVRWAWHLYKRFRSRSVR